MKVEAGVDALRMTPACALGNEVFHAANLALIAY
jgi:hypothetical protein